MRFQCVTILAVVAAVASAAPLAEYLGEVGEKTGWKCVGSEEGKVVYIPFEGYYESKGGRIESPRFRLDGECFADEPLLLGPFAHVVIGRGQRARVLEQRMYEHGAVR